MQNKYNESYDAKCKDILSYKFVLSVIMKYCLEEYEACEFNEIAQLIESHSEGEKVLGIQNAFPNHEYDLLFTSKLPNSKHEIDMFINMEPQKTTHLKYQLHNRGFFYIGHEITYQYGRSFKKSEYDKLKKVVSIFISFDAPTKEEENSLTIFHLSKDIKIGYNKVEKEDYDKIQVIIVYLGQESSQHPLLRFLELIFSNELILENRIELLEKEYGLSVSDSFKEEAKEMCHLSELVEKRGIEKGITQGIDLTMIQNIKNLMLNLNLTLDDAIKALGLNDKDSIKYKSLILEITNKE